MIWYNMKSTYKPCLILPTGTNTFVYPEEEAGGPPNTNFWGWNHYPVSQMISDGRVAQTWDRMTHTSMVLQDICIVQQKAIQFHRILFKCLGTMPRRLSE
jgi:hypothetical protein